MAYDFDLICIGSGPAGQRAAVQAAKLGKRAAVVEKRREVGGVCVDTGTIPSKTLREAVLYFAGTGSSRFDRREASRNGGRPTAEQLLGRVAETIRNEQEVVEAQLRRNDVQLIAGEAYFVDPHTLGVRHERGDQKYTAEFILIAVGTFPAPPPTVKADGQIILTSDDIVNLKALPKTLTVVGGGVIGIEYAAMFARLGIDVTVVERRDRPLDFVDREIVDELMHQMRQSNVVFRMTEAVSSVDIDNGPVKRAIIRTESGKRIAADAVLYSVGRIAATAPLALDAAGLTPGDRGKLTVDEAYRTAVPHIFAAGDVLGAPALAAISAEQGRLAACHAFGATCGSVPWHFPYGIYAIPEISMVGATEQELTDHKVPYETGVARYREIARGQILGDDSGLFKMLFHAETRQLLGVHVMGTSATELVHIGQAVLALGGGLEYFLDTVFNYPTLAECYKVAALDASNKLRG
jgi:NAD(P) transhydrogenase